MDSCQVSNFRLRPCHGSPAPGPGAGRIAARRPGGPSGWALKPESGTMNLYLSLSSAGQRLRRSAGPCDRHGPVTGRGNAGSASSTVTQTRRRELRLKDRTWKLEHWKLLSLGYSAGESPVTASLPPVTRSDHATPGNLAA